MRQYDFKDPGEVAAACYDFINSEFGKYLMSHLGVQYNGYHQRAEDEELSIERKAMMVERAAGVKTVIDFLSGRAALYESGHYRKEDEPKPDA